MRNDGKMSEYRKTDDALIIETNENHRTDKVFFYVRSGLFFFRMMYAKDRNKEAAEDIRNARRAFLDSIHDNTTTLPRRMRLELFLLKYCEPLYRQQAKIYWGGDTGRKCKV